MQSERCQYKSLRGRYSHDDHVRQSVYGQRPTPVAFRLLALPIITVAESDRWQKCETGLILYCMSIIRNTDVEMVMSKWDLTFLGKKRFHHHKHVFSILRTYTSPIKYSLLLVTRSFIFMLRSLNSSFVHSLMSSSLRYPSLSASLIVPPKIALMDKVLRLLCPNYFSLRLRSTVLLLFLGYVFKRNMNVFLRQDQSVKCQ